MKFQVNFAHIVNLLSIETHYPHEKLQALFVYSAYNFSVS